MTTQEPSVADTILAQLNGRKFIVMTGARHLMSDGNALSFRLPSGFANSGINYVKIWLDPNDTYRLEFGKVRGMNYKTISTFNDVYCDMLRPLFERETGLRTSL